MKDEGLAIVKVLTYKSQSNPCSLTDYLKNIITNWGG